MLRVASLTGVRSGRRNIVSVELSRTGEEAVDALPRGFRIPDKPDEQLPHRVPPRRLIRRV